MHKSALHRNHLVAKMVIYMKLVSTKIGCKREAGIQEQEDASDILENQLDPKKPGASCENGNHKKSLFMVRK